MIDVAEGLRMTLLSAEAVPTDRVEMPTRQLRLILDEIERQRDVIREYAENIQALDEKIATLQGEPQEDSLTVPPAATQQVWASEDESIKVSVPTDNISEFKAEGWYGGGHLVAFSRRTLEQRVDWLLEHLAIVSAKTNELERRLDAVEHDMPEHPYE